MRGLLGRRSTTVVGKRSNDNAVIGNGSNDSRTVLLESVAAPGRPRAYSRCAWWFQIICPNVLFHLYLCFILLNEICRCAASSDRVDIAVVGNCSNDLSFTRSSGPLGSTRPRIRVYATLSEFTCLPNSFICSRDCACAVYICIEGENCFYY